MIALAGSVLLASLVGSSHCAGMCGGIAAFCGGAGECGGRRSMMATGTYHVARAMSYVIVGLAAGGIGSLLDAGGALVGLQQMTAVVAGIAVALCGVALLLSASGVDAGRSSLPAWLQRAVSAVHRAAASMPPVRRAAVIGLATPLLPCGWLWAFALVAAGTGSALDGGVVMLAFWAGTVPILALLGAGIAALGHGQRRALAALAGVAMVAVGVHTAGMRAGRAVPIAQRLTEQSIAAGHTVERGDDINAEGEATSSGETPTKSTLLTTPVRPACCQEGHAP